MGGNLEICGESIIKLNIIRTERNTKELLLKVNTLIEYYN